MVNRLACVWAALMLLAPVAPAQGSRPGPPPGPRPNSMMGGTPTLVTGAPYSAIQVLQTQQNLANGIVIQNQQQTKVYRDSRGRTRTESVVSGKEGSSRESFVTIFDPAVNATVQLEASSQTARKSMFPRGGFGGERGPGPPPMGRTEKFDTLTTDLGSRNINGLNATGTRVTLTIPAGAIGNNQPIPVIRETWVSTDLKVPLLITSSDPRFGNSTMQLTNIVRSEPDPALFSIPADYRIINDRGFGPGPRDEHDRPGRPPGFGPPRGGPGPH